MSNTFRWTEEHYPMGVLEDGNGPVLDDITHHYVCACGAPDCDLAVALREAWVAGARAGEHRPSLPDKQCPKVDAHGEHYWPPDKKNPGIEFHCRGISAHPLTMIGGAGR